LKPQLTEKKKEWGDQKTRRKGERKEIKLGRGVPERGVGNQVDWAYPAVTQWGNRLHPKLKGKKGHPWERGTNKNLIISESGAKNQNSQHLLKGSAPGGFPFPQIEERSGTEGRRRFEKK